MEGKTVQAPFLIKIGRGVKVSFCKEHSNKADKMANAKSNKPLLEILIQTHGEVDKVFGKRKY
jgi:hypothetical protein